VIELPLLQAPGRLQPCRRSSHSFQVSLPKIILQVNFKSEKLIRIDKKLKGSGGKIFSNAFINTKKINSNPCNID
jgi:hypothetical protein